MNMFEVKSVEESLTCRGCCYRSLMAWRTLVVFLGSLFSLSLSLFFLNLGFRDFSGVKSHCGPLGVDAIFLRGEIS